MLPLTAQRQEQELTAGNLIGKEEEQCGGRENPEGMWLGVIWTLQAPLNHTAWNGDTKARCTVAVSPPIPMTLIPRHQDSDFVWKIMCLATRLVEISHGHPRLLHPEPLPLQQASADPYLCRRHSNTVLVQLTRYDGVLREPLVWY